MAQANMEPQSSIDRTTPAVIINTRLRRSPYFYSSREHGVAGYIVYNHHYHPFYYNDPIHEYWTLVNGVTLWDVGGAERQVEIAGPDAFKFTNMMVSRDLNKCAVGQCKYTFVLAEDGGIINDPVLLRLDENRFWLSLADSDVLLWARALAYGMGFDVEIREPDVGPVQVQGPKSKDVMVDIFGDSVLEIPYYFLRDYELDGMQMMVSRTGFSGEAGYEIYLKNASRDGDKLWQTIFEAGRPHGMEVIAPSQIRRIEAGMLSHGADMDVYTNPFEVGYGYKWMVELDQKQGFVGKEALRKVSEEGVSRKLVGVEIGGDPLGSYNDNSMIDFFPVYTSDAADPADPVGKVTSACYSPRLEKNIGYAMLPIEYAGLGTKLQIDTPGGRAPSTVVEKPFHDPKKEIAHH